MTHSSTNPCWSQGFCMRHWKWNACTASKQYAWSGVRCMQTYNTKTIRFQFHSTAPYFRFSSSRHSRCRCDSAQHIVRYYFYSYNSFSTHHPFFNNSVVRMSKWEPLLFERNGQAAMRRRYIVCTVRRMCSHGMCQVGMCVCVRCTMCTLAHV